MRLIQGDCMEILPQLIEEGVKVDMVFVDLPYGEVACKWDKQLDLPLMFDHLKQLVKVGGAMCFTATFKFAIELVNACPELFKYEWVWEKDNGTNVPLINYMPYRIHEYVLVFSEGRCTHGTKTPAIKYNPQKWQGKPYIAKRKGNRGVNWRNLPNMDTFNIDGMRHPLSIQYFKRERGLHSTQKPVDMCRYFIKTYSDEGDTVLDFTMGSGSTGVACKQSGRHFIGIEYDSDFFKKAKNRINSQEVLV